MTSIEDQAMTVYHFWLLRERVGGDEDFDRQLCGLFEMLREKFPEDFNEVHNAAMRKIGV